jgi:hypothetical protein
MSETLVSKELDYKIYTNSHPTYAHSKIMPQTGTLSLTMTPTGGEETIFEISPKVINLAKTYLQFTCTLAITAGGRSNKVFADTVPQIRQIQLYTRTGKFLVDVQYANTYLNAISRHENINTDIYNNNPLNVAGEYFNGIYRSNGDAFSCLRPAGGAGATPQFEPAYGATGAANAVQAVNYKIPLGIYKNTGLDCDKDLYFGGEVLYLKIIWDTFSYTGISTDSTTAYTTPLALASGPAISNLTLFLAIEKNPVVENQVKAKTMSPEGLSILFPYVHVNQIQLNATGVNGLHALQVRYNRSHGSKLKKIIWAPYVQNRSGVNVYNHNNLALDKIISFYTTVNNVRTNEYDYLCVNNDDYAVRKEKIKGSCIYSASEYYYNFNWIENFTDSASLTELSTIVKEFNVDEGLDLTNEIIYAIMATTNNKDLTHHIFAVTQKMLRISPAGVDIM